MPRHARGATVIEGVRPVLEAIRAGRRRVLEVTLPGPAETSGQRELAALLEQRGIPVRRSIGPPQGVVAQAEPYVEEPFEELLLGAGPRFLVALDRVTDVGNLGAIARSAEAAGATGLILEHRRAPPIGPGALRASAGALEHLRVGRTPRLKRALELARGEDVAVLIAEAGGSPLSEVDPALLRGDLVWVFGSEDRGVRAGIRSLGQAIVGIPLHGRISVLGVAAAAAFLLHRTAEVRES